MLTFTNVQFNGALQFHLAGNGHKVSRHTTADKQVTFLYDVEKEEAIQALIDAYTPEMAESFFAKRELESLDEQLEEYRYRIAEDIALGNPVYPPVQAIYDRKNELRAIVAAAEGAS